jgi:hypothetical protein
MMVGHVLHPRLDQSGDRLGLHHRGIILTGQQHEFPAAVVAAPRHDGGAARIAHHHRQALQIGGAGTPLIGGSDRALDLGIDDQPGFLEIQIVERDAQRLAHRAARAVTGDDPAGGQGWLLRPRIGDDAAVLLRRP